MVRTQSRLLVLVARVALAALLALSLVAMGCGGNGASGDDTYVPPEDAGADVQVEPDEGPITPDIQPDIPNVEPDIQPDIPFVEPDVQPDQIIEPDVQPDIEQCDPAQCAIDLADQIGPCEEAVCTQAGDCAVARATAAPACCETAAECDDGNPLTRDTCPVPGEACVPVPQPCGSDSWCANNWPGPNPQLCEQVRCCLGPNCQNAAGGAVAQGSCYIADNANCCITDGDCDDGNPCTNCSCEPGAGGTCFCVPSPACICDEQVIFEAQFDDGSVMSNGFDVFDWDESDSVTWTIVRDGLYAGRGLYLGDPDCRTYFNGEHDGDCEYDYPPELDPIHGTEVLVDLVTQEISLPAATAEGGLYMLEFFIQGEGETPLGIPGLPDADALVVQVEDLAAPGPYEVLFTTASYDNFLPMGTFVATELSAFAGKTVRLHFTFDTFDASNNRYEGWYLDAVRIRSYCANRRCDGGATCNVLSACMDDTCTEFANAPGAAVCAEIIDPPGCQPCTTPADCDDMDDCTIESCDGGVCTWQPDPSPACCASIGVLAADFQNGQLPFDWNVSADGTDVRWQVYTDGVTGQSSLYFGDPDTMTYDNGHLALGSVTTEPFDLPDPALVQVINLIAYWDLKLSTEFDAGGTPWTDSVVIDRLTLYANYLNEGGEPVREELWSSVVLEGTTQGEWVLQGVDLLPYAGKTVWFEWEFNSGEDAGEPALANLYGGAFIDNFHIKTVCGEFCFSDAMCEVESECWLSTCEDATCSAPVLVYEGCCETVADCLAGNDCTTVTCNGNTCRYQDDGNAATCCDGTTFATGFEFAALPDTYEVTQVDNGDPLNMTTWQVSTRCGRNGGSGLYFGDDTFGDYQSMEPEGVAATVLTPEISIPSSGAGAATWLQFDLFLDTEWNDVPREGWIVPETQERDALKLYAVQGAQRTQVWSSYDIDFRGSTCHDGACGWQTVQVDLSAYHGYSLQFLFDFDSYDDIDNAHLGVCVDNLSVVSSCAGEGYECFSSEDCPTDGPADECYWYYCVDNVCDEDYVGGLNCCDVASFAAASWESGAEGWSFFPDSGTVRWQVASVAGAQDGDAYLYFGNVAAQNYDGAGSAVGGEALSPRFVLPSVNALTDEITLSFWYYLDVEPFDVGDPSRDAFTLTVINNLSGAETVLLSKSNIPAAHIGADPPVWRRWEADLTAFAGEDISLQFLFDSGDETNNDGLGILIDALEIETEICD